MRQVAEVYLNGKLLGVSKTGFTPFGFDLTPHLKFDGPNVLAVMCDNRFMKDPLGPDEATAELRQRPSRVTSLAELSAKVNAMIPEIRRRRSRPTRFPGTIRTGIRRTAAFIAMCTFTSPTRCTSPCRSTVFSRPPGLMFMRRIFPTSRPQVNLEVPVENGRTTDEKVAAARRSLRPRRQIRAHARPDRDDRGRMRRADFKLSGDVKNPQLWEPAYPYLSIGSCARCACAARPSTPAESRSASARCTGNRDRILHQRPASEAARLGTEANRRMARLGRGAARLDAFLTLQLMKEAGGNFVRWGHCAGGPASITAATGWASSSISPGSTANPTPAARPGKCARRRSAT